MKNEKEKILYSSSVQVFTTKKKKLRKHGGNDTWRLYIKTLDSQRFLYSNILLVLTTF